jgi:ribosomal protein L7/L12
LLAEFDVASEGVMGLAQSGLVSEQTALSSDASSLVVALQAHTSTAIENITAAREALEIGLGEA